MSRLIGELSGAADDALCNNSKLTVAEIVQKTDRLKPVLLEVTHAETRD